MAIAFVNQSTAVDDQAVLSMAQACHSQLQNEVAEAWQISTPLAVTTKPSTGDYIFYFVDDIPEAPGALAYHDVDAHGIPYGKIGVKTTLGAGESVSSAASHEAVELQCDIWCASWSFSNTLNCLVATEACDPVQNDTYKIQVADGSEVEVSNFVTPKYFTPQLRGPFDHLGSLARAFEIGAGGYQIQMTAGTVKNVFGSSVPPALIAGKLASRGRTFWRHVTIALALEA
jgi:hypothetical protein